MPRRRFAMNLKRALSVAAATLLVASTHAQAPTSPPLKVMRYAFEVAESSMDPAKVSDNYSRILTANIFEGLYRYDQ